MATAVLDKKSLLRLLSNHRMEIKSYGVKQLGLFGSFVRDNAIHEGSDIDLLVEFEKDKKTYDNFIELCFYLEELLGRKVELVTPESLSKYLGPHILKQVEDAGL
jgi:hypothetical protein